MFDKTRPLHLLSLNTILYGKPSLSNDENFPLFQTVQPYIKDSERFFPYSFCFTEANG